MGIVALRSYPELPHRAFAATLVVRESAPKLRLLDRVRQAIDTVALERLRKVYRELLVKKNAHRPAA
jgi:hypothetical protein